MARPIRVEFEDAVYHVTARGNDHQPVFLDDKDRLTFLATIARMAAQFGVKVHAYCLMSNHYHVILETPRGNLSRAMAWLQTTYTVRFQWRHRRAGHLFQGRFKAHLVEVDAYAQRLVCYVHLNPVRPRDKKAPIPPGRVRDLELYTWSSHLAYAHGLQETEKGWLCLDWLEYWGRSEQRARRAYRASIQDAFGRSVRSPWLELSGGLVLGGGALREKASGLMERKAGREERVWLLRQRQADVEARVQTVLAGEPDKRIHMWARVRVCGHRAADVAREYGYRDVSGVSQVIKRLETQAEKDRGLGRQLTAIRHASVSIVKR